ncbi:hypothetical protein CRENBAI_003104 [Crenichthys baileyi]|uniref:RIB43A-like with coiled-coils protein 2 n=1 Tax=Crenichthys baileyi TaxID=28760 RepID=A0AAV9QVD4_9TELE
MFNVELISERVARESLERRRQREAERRERIFNEKFRIIGVDKKALDLQLQEKKRREEEAKREQNTYNADMHQYNKAACLIQRGQEKEKRVMEKATATFWHQNQQPQNRREFDLNDPDNLRKTDAQMVLPGLVGEDPEKKSRLQRQREQLRDWLIQQQDEQEEDRLQQKMEELNYDQSRIEMENTALELQNLEMERRKAATIATTNYNLARIEEKCNQERERRDEDCARSTVGVPGLSPSNDRRRAAPETQQEIIQFQQGQIEEKKRIELEKKREEENYDRIRLDSARKALLMERQQARLNKQLRRHLDSTNTELVQTHLQQKPDLKRGHIEDIFFSKFNTCSR